MTFHKTLSGIFLLISTAVLILGLPIWSEEYPVLLKKNPIQGTPTDCGAACLKFILEEFGIDVELDELRRMTLTNESGTSMLSLKNVAQDLGLPAEGWRVAHRDLDLIPLPSIVLLENQHFAVLLEVSHTTVRILDPAHGELEMSLSLFTEGWNGITLTFQEWSPDSTG